MRPTVRSLVSGIAVVVMLVAGSLSRLMASSDRNQPDPNDPSLVARGKLVYAQQCVSCHGANLEGQPNWQKRLPNGRLPAPQHDRTGHTWHHSDRQTLRDDQDRNSRDDAGLRNRHARLQGCAQRRRHLGRALVHREHVACRYSRAAATNESAKSIRHDCPSDRSLGRGGDHFILMIWPRANTGGLGSVCSAHHSNPASWRIISGA